MAERFVFDTNRIRGRTDFDGRLPVGLATPDRVGYARHFYGAEASMKRAILLLVVVVGGAFYLGWFTFTTESNGPTERVNIDFDKNKIQASEQQAIEGIKKFEQQIENRAATASSASSGQTATFTPPGSFHIGGDGTPSGTATTIGPDPYEATATKPAGGPAAQTASEPFSRGFE